MSSHLHSASTVETRSLRKPIADDESKVTVPTTVGFEHYHVIGGCAAKKIWELEGRGEASKKRNLKAARGKKSQTRDELETIKSEDDL
jgi:hypothetical protein